ncbi:MAG: hypothetical protein ACTS1X_03590 [Parasphingopyxis sp.]|uniref:hypothetical protein n=1 Tax=Parasphingopyxis sp. TaxID=1920299 RepID=UPI003F9EBDDB
MSEGRKDTDGGDAGQGMAKPGRRQVLALGAAAASTVVTVRPALAQTQASIMACEIPIPDPGRMGNYIAADGSVVPPGTPGAFPPPGRNLVGEEVRGALQAGRTIPGYGYEQSQAYTNYIRRLQTGMSGFTCYASIQMTRS